MSRLVVNPNTPQAWEIQLKPGDNSVGRGEANDFQIQDASVSTRHCLVTVGDGAVVLHDLDSTNGTFVNDSPVQEVRLADGQSVRFGNVELLFHADGPPIPAPAMPSPRLKPAGLRISVSAHAAPAEASDALPPMMPIAPVVSTINRFCKFHPQALARFVCPKCNRTFCDLCVTTRATEAGALKTCRTCGVEVAPLELRVSRTVEKSFYAKLPGALIYPFRDMGPVILICATLAFAALGFMSAGLLSLAAKVMFYGFLFLFMQNIIHSTVSDETEGLSFPEASGLLGAALQLGGTVLMSFGLTIGLLIARLSGVEIPSEAIIAATILGCLYFPMAFLAVAMKDSVAAGNPLIVLPSILKIPKEYSVAAFLLLGVYGISQLGSILSGVAGTVTFTTNNMNVLLVSMAFQAVWSFISVYLLVVNIRILGLLYNSTKEKLGWY